MNNKLDPIKQRKEVNRRVCKICREICFRILEGSFNYKDKRYVDEVGGVWNGNTCPPCHRKKIKLGMNKLRAKKPSIATPETAS